MPNVDAVADLIALLELGVACQAGRDFSRLDEQFDQFELHHGKYSGELSEWVHYGRNFVGCWIDAANHNWQYHEPVRETDWVPLAREIGSAVSAGQPFVIPVVGGISFDES